MQLEKRAALYKHRPVILKVCLSSSLLSATCKIKIKQHLNNQKCIISSTLLKIYHFSANYQTVRLNTKIQLTKTKKTLEEQIFLNKRLSLDYLLQLVKKEQNKNTNKTPENIRSFILSNLFTRIDKDPVCKKRLE